MNLRNILSSRASKAKRRPPPKRLDPQELRKIEEKAQVLLAIPQLYQKFVDLKYASLEDRVSEHAGCNQRIQKEYDQLISASVGNLENLVRQSSKRNQTLEHEYCTIKFRESPSLARSVVQTDEAIASLRHEVFNAVIDSVEVFTVNLGQMLEIEYLRPRQSARAKIDEFLNSLETIHRQYSELQEKGNAARDGFRDLRMLCIELIRANSRHRLVLGELMDRHRILQAEYDIAAHNHRHWWIKRHHSRHPLMESASLLAGGMVKFADRVFAGISTDDVVRAMMCDGYTHVWMARKLAKCQYAIADAIRVGYMERWNGPKPVDDPFLSTLWRQLDLTAPFDLLQAFDSLMMYEIWYLIGTIQRKLGPMWDNLTPVESKYHAARLHQWAVEFRQQQKDFLREYMAYKQINLIRFEIEKRLHELGVPNDIRERGLFVTQNPLSQDHAQFQRWVTRYSSITFEAFRMLRILQLFTNPKLWERLVNKYQAANHAKRDALIQKFGSVIGRRRIGRTQAEIGYFRRKRRSAIARSTRKGFKESPRSTSKQESLSADQQPAAGSHEASQPSMEGHQVPSATSTLHSGMNVRNQPGRESTDNSPQNTAAQSATTGSQTAPKSWETRSAPCRRLPGKPWIRTYCTDSRVSRNATRKDHDQSLLEQTPASCIPVIAEPTEGDRGLARTTISPKPTISSPTELKAKKVATPLFWSHNLHRGPDGRKLIVNYCRSLATTEEVARHFLNSEVIGFDMEWKAQASALDGIQNNLSLIQLANEERIALFQIAKFKPARSLQDLVAPSLKRVLESPDITKVGVAIKGDATRLRKYLGIEARSVFELSHLFKLVKYGLRSRNSSINGASI